MKRTLVFLAAVAMSMASPRCAQSQIVAEPDSLQVAFAAGELKKTLAAKGTTGSIVVGTFDWLHGKYRAAQPPAVAEAFAITKLRDGTIVVAGHDDAGAMYGGLEVAEQIRLGGPSEIRETVSQPFLPVRQFKYNIPSVRDRPEWFHSEKYWRSFLDLLADSRFNSLGFWHLHPFPYMIAFDKFPEAAILSPKQTQRNLKTYSMIFRMARERNISTFLINWNIHLSPNFAKAHGIPARNYDSSLVREYTRYCVARVLRTYPDLTGLGVCAGEHLPSEFRLDWDRREEWVKDTFVAGIKESGRVVPLIHRYWQADPGALQRIIAADYPGQVMVPVKFNGEHIYSDVRPHFLDRDFLEFPEWGHWDMAIGLPRRKGKAGADPSKLPVGTHLQWIRQQPRDYKILWHLRNDCMFTFRWGDPEFVRQVARNCRSDYSLGFLMGAERMQGGLDRSHVEAAKAHQTWRYEHERHWFRFMLWGRLGYDPTIPETHWQALFRERFGLPSADLYTAYVASSRIIPTTTRFHFNYMNADWLPERCWGGWNTGAGRWLNYRDRRDRRGFHDVVEFVFNHTIEDGLLDIPEYVGMLLRGERISGDLVTPLQIADQLQAAADETRDALTRARQTGKLVGEAECYCQEFAATAELGAYYAEKIRAATELMHFFATGDIRRRDAAVTRLKSAVDYWRKFVAHYEPHFRQHTGGRPTYARMLTDVETDIFIAKNANAAPRELRDLGVLKRASDRPRFDFSSLEKLVETQLVPLFPNPLRIIDSVDLSPAAFDVMVLGKEAWAFNDLQSKQKRKVLDAVERGLPLVVFFQNYPEFDFSWFPHGINGSGRDSSTFLWVREHPIAEGVDPAQLTGLAKASDWANDCLAGYGSQWQILTDPPAVAVLDYGKSRIVLCQIEALGKTGNPAADRLVMNIVKFATGGKRRPRILVLDGNKVRHLDRSRHKVMWLDETR